MERNSAKTTHPHNKTLIDVDKYTDSIQHILISDWRSLETILQIVFFATRHGKKRRNDRLKTEKKTCVQHATQVSLRDFMPAKN